MVDVIYKFMPFREKFFDNRWLRFTPRLLLNDPFEVRPAFSQHADYIHNVKGHGESVQSVIEQMERNQPFLMEGIVFQDFDMYGILSLTERVENLLMWSHYGDDHRGMCIGFDPSHDFFDGAKSDKEHVRNSVNEYIGVLKKVRYSGVRKTKTNNLFEYFFLKSNDWWTERELRYVLPIAGADEIKLKNLEDQHKEELKEDMAFYQVPSDAIVSVTFGLKCPDRTIKDTVDLLKSREEYQHVKLYKAQMCNEGFDLKVISITDDFKYVWNVT